MTQYLKFCFHTGSGGIGYPKENLTALNARGIPFGAKATDAMPYDAQEIARANPAIPNTVIFRRSVVTAVSGPAPSGNPDVPQYDLPPQQAAINHWAWHRANLPPELDPAITWVETINEPAQEFVFSENEEDKAREIPLFGLRSIYQRSDGRWVVTNGEWLAKFALETAYLTMKDGYRWAAFGWGPGEPETAVWHGAHMVEFLLFAGRFPERVAVALHEYSLTTDDITAGDGWLVGRFLKLYAACDDNEIPYPTTMITEWGWTLNSVPDWGKAKADYLEIGELYAAFPTIRLAAVWALNTGWGGIAVEAQKHIGPLQDLTMTTTFEDVIEPPPVVTPPPACSWFIDVGRKVHLIPQDTTLAELNWATVKFHAAKNSFVYSHDDGGLIPAHGNADRSVVVVWNPERWVSFDILAWYAERGVKTQVDYFPNTEPPKYPIYWQRDPRWAEHLCGFGPKTIAQWGCLLCVYTMLADHWGINNGREPSLENEYYKSKGAFSGQNLVSMAMSKAYPQVKNAGWATDPTVIESKTKDYLSRGIPVPAQVDFKPTTADRNDQHWVLIVGWNETLGWLMNDPWTGKTAVPVKDYYGIAGSDLLQCLFYYLDETPTTPPPTGSGDLIDQTQYYTPAGTASYAPITILSTNWGAGDVRQQVQRHGSELFVTKGHDIEVRSLDVAKGVIRFLLDDSPGNGEYYTVASPDGWLPTKARVGDQFTRHEIVTYYYKNGCVRTGAISDWTSVMRFAKFYPTWTSPGNPHLTYQNVSEWHWVLNGAVEEKYFLVPQRAYGYWWNRHGRFSAIKEDIPVGQQGNNVFPGACYHAPVGVAYP